MCLCRKEMMTMENKLLKELYDCFYAVSYTHLTLPTICSV